MKSLQLRRQKMQPCLSRYFLKISTAG